MYACMYVCMYVCISAALTAHAKDKVAAFLRVKDEIKTIEATLTSIDGIFDKIVIIHSNEKDDGSIALMNRWCKKRKYCEIHEYPYPVISSHSEKYNKKYPKESSLAAYYNFGLQFFEPEEWVVKIDADQVYISDKLKKFVDNLHLYDDKEIYFGLYGYNTFKWKEYLVKYKPLPFNGQNGDSFVLKRKYFANFKQHRFYEKTILNQPLKNIINHEPVWFHFMTTLKSDGKILKNDELEESKVLFLNEDEKALFNEKIRPLLINSPYRDIKLEK